MIRYKLDSTHKNKCKEKRASRKRDFWECSEFKPRKKHTVISPYNISITLVIMFGGSYFVIYLMFLHTVNESAYVTLK